MNSHFTRPPHRLTHARAAIFGFAASALLLVSAPALSAQATDPSLERNSGFVATNGIAAQVNDKIITLDQLRQQILPIVPEIRRRSATRDQFEQNIALVTREVLQNLVDQILIVREFNEKGYMLPEAYIRNEMEDYVIKNFGGDRSRFLESLRQQGTNEMGFRNQMKDSIIVSYMRSQMVRSATQVSPEEINQYYQQHRSQFYEDAGVKLSMIMLTPAGSENGERVAQQVAAIQKGLADGVPFADLAKRYSQDPNASEGGDWGWRRYSDLRKELAAAVEPLEKGQVSDPVELSGITYILYVEDKRDSGVKDLDTVRAEIEGAITSQLARQAQQRWLERLRKQAYIRYYLEEAGPSPIIDNAPVTMRIGQGTPAANGTDAAAQPNGQTPAPLPPSMPGGMPTANPRIPQNLEQKKTVPPLKTEQTPPTFDPNTGRFEESPGVRGTYTP